MYIACTSSAQTHPSLSHRNSLTENKLKDTIKDLMRATAGQLIKCGALLSIRSYVITLFKWPWNWSCLHIPLSRRLDKREDKGWRICNSFHQLFLSCPPFLFLFFPSFFPCFLAPPPPLFF